MPQVARKAETAVKGLSAPQAHYPRLVNMCFGETDKSVRSRNFPLRRALTHAMKPAKILIGIFAASAMAHTQTSPVAAQQIARARQLLHSPELADRAWGAYLAARLDSSDLREAVIGQLRAASLLPGPSGLDQYAFAASLLDAAIQMNLSVPAALLEPIEEKWKDAVLILLARAPGAEDSLLRLAAAHGSDEEWLAANNLLFDRKSPRWYESILGDLKITLRFTVIDAETVRESNGGVGGGYCGDTLVPRMPEGGGGGGGGFPPIAHYMLRRKPERGSVLLAEGPHSVYFQRTIQLPGHSGGFGMCSSPLDRDGTRFDFLARLADIPPSRAEIVFRGETLVLFTNGLAFARLADERLKTQEQEVRDLIQEIRKHGMTSASELRVGIEPEVSDRRKNTTEPLPSIPPREILLN